MKAALVDSSNLRSTEYAGVVLLNGTQPVSIFLAKDVDVALRLAEKTGASVRRIVCSVSGPVYRAVQGVEVV